METIVKEEDLETFIKENMLQEDKRETNWQFKIPYTKINAPQLPGRRVK